MCKAHFFQDPDSSVTTNFLCPIKPGNFLGRNICPFSSFPLSKPKLCSLLLLLRLGVGGRVCSLYHRLPIASPREKPKYPSWKPRIPGHTDRTRVGTALQRSPPCQKLSPDSWQAPKAQAGNPLATLPAPALPG